MNMKLVGLLIAVVILLLGVVAMLLNRTPEPRATVPVAVTPSRPDLPKPNPRGGSYKKSEPGKWEWTEPGKPKK
jgi:hypothetical protein